MSHLTIELPPEVEQRLRKKATQRGQKVEDFARSVLEQSLEALGETPLGAFWSELPRRSPADLVALAGEQGVKPVSRVEDLKGDFWPEDESVDEFVEAVRRWRRGEE